jgi:tRNA-modifying protein YgfZ
MTVVSLPDRALIAVSGADAEHFLQNILTTDLDQLAAGETRPGALLSPQGKILFDFLISRSGDAAFLLECRSDIAEDFVRRLTLYRLRAKVEIVLRNQRSVAVSWNDDPASLDLPGLIDRRFLRPGVVRRHYDTPLAATGSPDDWHRLRIVSGVAESGPDYALGEAFPHDVLLDQLGGVGLRKGCYIGQEVVSRMQHRGTARRRVLLAKAGGGLPPSGTEIKADGRPVGQLGSVDGPAGLAIARIDRVKDAMDAGTPLLADDVAVSLSIPDWASFSFPEAATGTEGA